MLKTFWNWLLGIEKEVEDEIRGILPRWHEEIDKLEELASSKLGKANTLAAKIEEDTAAKVKAEADAAKVTEVAKTLKAAIGAI